MEKTITRRQLGREHTLQENLHPILNRIYLARGVESAAELERELTNLIPFNSLTHIDDAVERIVQALIKQEKILIVGDFDTDGATSVAVATTCLRLFGAENVDFMVPNRFNDGYGLTPSLVDAANEAGTQLLITVDNGISSHQGVQRANELNIDVVVTDHHLPPAELPAAYTIINPNLVGDQFPSKAIAGVGVIYYVMLACRRELIDAAWFSERNIPQPNMAAILDLVALGTVADVVPLDRNNRILVHQGLLRIRQGRACPGIQALLEVGNREPSKITAADLGFAVAPRLNAAGRLEDMRLGIECLLAQSLTTAREMAQQLDQLNQERKAIEADMQEQAFSAIRDISLDEQQRLPSGLCLYQEDWHQGVIGIIAGRVKDKFHRPVIAFAKVDNHELKGSARSIKGLHIRDVLEAIASKHPSLITKYGGHAMAAGLSLPIANYEKFNQIFTEAIDNAIDKSLLRGEIISDGELYQDELNLELAQLLREAGPWGQSFPEPIFDGEFNIIEQRIVGNKHLKLVLAQAQTQQVIDAIAFNVNLEQWPNYRCDKIHIAYRVDVNEFRQRQSLQLIIEHLTAVNVI